MDNNSNFPPSNTHPCDNNQVPCDGFVIGSADGGSTKRNSKTVEGGPTVDGIVIGPGSTTGPSHKPTRGDKKSIDRTWRDPIIKP